MNLNQVTLPCFDYDATVRFYTNLGLTQIVDSPARYARFVAANGATFSIHHSESFEPCPDAVIYFEVDDVDDTVNALKSRGVDFETEPVDQRWLWREAYLRDPSGNRLCIYHAGQNRRYPSWRIA